MTISKSSLAVITTLIFSLNMRLIAQHVPYLKSEVETGRALFQRSCAGCHGENAKGGRGPDLTSGKWKWGSSESDLERVILKGIPGTQMPPFDMPDQEAKAIVAFLQSFQARKQERTDGNPEAGKQLFFGSRQCSRCHMYGGKGGRLGPDLSSANEKTAGELRVATTHPGDKSRENFDPVEVEFRDGRVLRGVAKNQDTF